MEHDNDLSTLTDNEILAIANPLIDNLMQGSTERNYDKHAKDFTQRLKNIVTKENLEQQWQNNELGDFTKRELISIIRKKDGIFVLWKQYLSKSTDEFLAEIYIVEENGRFLVDHNWIR